MSDALGRIPQEARGLRCDAMGGRMALQSPHVRAGRADGAWCGAQTLPASQTCFGGLTRAGPGREERVRMRPPSAGSRPACTDSFLQQALCREGGAGEGRGHLAQRTQGCSTCQETAFDFSRRLLWKISALPWGTEGRGRCHLCVEAEAAW